MKMRKLFAGIAAAATLLGGMALGATSAQAAAATSITISNAQAGHTYTSYKFADLKLDTTVTPNAVEVTTATGWSEAIKTALSWNTLDEETQTLYSANPAAYVATLKASSDAFRDFAANLAATGTSTGTVTPTTTGTTTVPVSGDGWYLVTDSYTGNDGSSKKGTQAVVATTLDGMTGSFPVEGDTATGQGNITATGKFNAKNENAPDAPEKTVKKDNVSVDGGSANVGDKLSYTITAKISENAAGYDTYQFTISDVASKGLQVPSAKSDYTIKIDGADVSGLFGFTQTGDKTQGTTTTFATTEATAKQIPSYAGKNVVITYTATVTDEATANNKVSNQASVTTKNGTSGYGETVVYTYGFSFTKTDKNGNPLAGATFTLTDANNNVVRTSTTVNDGVISWSGLAAGTYTVKETNPPAGYSKAFLPTFKVTIKPSDTDKATAIVTISDTPLSGLVTQDKETNAITVENVKNVTQLPLTGAAGTALFTVVALLLAGAGATVVLKARSKNAMA
ncbi:SpaA isopeptide-forming pilin-related protein [Bifidobacterium moukalabense]|uniref:SpaA isopeptide-forming pilin-related protein n=1 Tax=Bifidobacterium moukalabense TaxID=1333651 RepID=UPI0010F79716|nr:isopeptide-forming domain-containing fimbrial protein [Bifidobacterium moukalabense]